MATFTSESKIIGQGITFDDVLLVPNYSAFSRKDIDLSTKLTKSIDLKVPFVSSPMDTVTESELAIKLAELGGIGIIHRNLTIDDQVKEVKKVLKKGLMVGAAVGANKGFEDRAEALVKAGITVLVIDSAHGHALPVITALKSIRKKFTKVQIIAGNISTAAGAEALIKAGADALRVGMGPGAICTTRIISGMGVPQITALFATAKVASRYKVPVIADGGIRYSGDMVKALVAGASTIMMGSFFASCEEAPGEKVMLEAAHVPSRFKNILKKDIKTYLFKSYRGMGSVGAMKKGADIKSEGEFHGKNYKDRVLVAEGGEGLVPVKGKLKPLIDQAIGGIKSGMYYVGAKTVADLQKNGRFLQITQASLSESHPHSLLITNPGENYG